MLLLLTGTPQVQVVPNNDIVIKPETKPEPPPFDLLAEKAKLAAVVQVVADELTDGMQKGCLAKKGNTAKECAQMKVVVKTVFMAAANSPGTAGFVVMRLGDQVDVGLFFIKQPDGTWVPLPEDFR